MNEYREMIMDGIRERHPDCIVTVECIKGNNGTSYEGILVKFNDRQCIPVIRCECMENAIQKGECSLDEVLDEADRILEERVDLDASYFMDYKNVKDKIHLRVINREQNEELLTNVPHREFLDLAVTYRIGPIHAGMAEGNTLVTYPMFSEWGITEDELYEIAYENSFKENPEIMSMAKLMGRIFADSEEEAESFWTGLTTTRDAMYVCGYKSLAGAACMINKHLLQNFSEELGADLLILPSSIYELIILPMKEEYNVEQFAQIVKEVNRNVVAANEVLSDHVYLYCQKTDMVVDLCEEH